MKDEGTILVFQQGSTHFKGCPKCVVYHDTQAFSADWTLLVLAGISILPVICTSTCPVCTGKEQENERKWGTFHRKPTRYYPGQNPPVPHGGVL
jgi:hypothetical protein